MSALINHLSENPSPPQASAKNSRHHAAHQLTLNGAVLTGRFSVENLQCERQCSQRILKWCHLSFTKLNHFCKDIIGSWSPNWISRSHYISWKMIDVSVRCHVPINVYHHSIKLQIKREKVASSFFFFFFLGCTGKYKLVEIKLIKLNELTAIY